MKQIEVQIMGQTYTLACPEGSQEPMERAVNRVDTAMCKIRDAGKIRARDRIAVLAALNVAFDLAERERRTGAHDAAPNAPTAETASSSDTLIHPRMQLLLQRMGDLLAEDGKLL